MIFSYSSYNVEGMVEGFKPMKINPLCTTKLTGNPKVISKFFSTEIVSINAQIICTQFFY